ncbi:MAG: substrate-binding domain-containing protein [Burkholderiales bacterium]|nr:substrate-binding domain-containing protein [Burkholderiales bacterium]
MKSLAKSRSARLADVARAAGVSLATASRALAASALVHSATSTRVQEAARLLGYVPHGAARALASRRTRTIGAVIPTLDNPIFAGSIQTLQSRLARDGYTLLLGSHEYDLAVEIKVVAALIERGVDAMVLVGLDHDPHLFALLVKAGIPYELTWAVDASGFHHCVGFSNREAAMRVAQHLLGLGHRRIAMVSGYTAQNDRARERVAGVREAMQSRGLGIPDDWVVECPFSIRDARVALQRLLETGARPTAVVCGNDILAAGVLLEAASCEIAVPAALSVTGFDDIDLAAEIVPALTTVHLPVVDIGRLAAERLLARLAGKRVARVERVPVELIARASTAPPAAAARRQRHNAKIALGGAM